MDLDHSLYGRYRHAVLQNIFDLFALVQFNLAGKVKIKTPWPIPARGFLIGYENSPD